MDEYLLSRINETVGEHDTLWFLGDFCFARSEAVYYETARQYRSRINCKNIHFIMGNHDEEHEEENIDKVASLFTSCWDLKKLTIDRQKIILCHYAFAVYPKRYFWNLYGHSHRNAEPWLDKNMPGRYGIDVGIDNAIHILGEYRPFAFEDLREIFKDRSGFTMDHHGR